MSGINKVILVGRLGKDPDIRTFETGVKRASFTMATDEVFKDKEGKRTEVTEWHNIVCWRNLAEIAEKYLSKGKQIYLEGKLRTRSWEDNGIKRYITEIEANTFTMLGAKSDNDSPVVEKVENRGNNLTPPDMGTPPTETNDLPF